MNKEYILNHVLTDGRGKGKRVQIGYPVVLKAIKSSHNIDTISLKIRDDINHFSDAERWSYAYLKEANRLYFFYGENTTSYKVRPCKGYHQIRFTDKDVLEILNSSNRNIEATCSMDDESGMYYIQF